MPSLKSLEAEGLRRARNKISAFFPETGPYRRELYPQHMGFVAAGATFPERLFMAANRVGKTELGAYELTAHATGDYPPWWNGKRFRMPIDAWAAGINNATTRDVIQEKLLGKIGQFGTGMIPADRIHHIANRQGLAGAVDTIYITSKHGGLSTIGLKSFEMGRESFQGTAKHVVWLDEECEHSIYTECLLRTATTDGILILTFTPLFGMSDVVKSFIEPEDDRARGVKHVTTATWDDVPHLSETAKAAIFASLLPHERDARTKGIPSLGVGAIYPIAESEVTVPRFEIPKHWPRAFGMDVGWNRTAAIWGAIDEASDTLYLWHEHYRGNAEPVIHAAAIKAPGAWIPGVIDPACLGGSQIDGRNLMDLYTELGLDLTPAINSVHSGIYDVWNRLSTGRLKVFEHLQNWRSEFRRYHRNEKGDVVKKDDHLMDATRYLTVSGRDVMRRPPAKKDPNGLLYGNSSPTTTSWMG